MKEDKELIDRIVDKLKNSQERPYRAGAWERFSAVNSAPKAAVYRVRRMWYAAASVILVLGMVWFVAKDAADDLPMAGHQHGRPGIAQPQGSTPSGVEPGVTSDAGRLAQKELYAEQPAPSEASIPSRNDGISQTARLSVATTRPDLSISTDVHIPAMSSLAGRDLSVRPMASMEYGQKIPQSKLHEHLASSAVIPGTVLAMKEVEPQNQFKQVRLNNRFMLGVFVSPYATGQKMNVGGGLALTYQLNNRLSIRTGASYNNYEVNTIKNPAEESSTETVVDDTPSALESASLTHSSYQHRVVIPNINAVKGFVRSIDIPVELKLHVNRSVYAVAGMSYSAILNQERNAYYIENVNTETFARGYPENKAQAADVVKPVTKSIELTEKNVSTNGFSGFVNFSLGKEVKVNKKMGVSLEPYLKIPVGQYRRADMDYTNGGIRIITNF